MPKPAKGELTWTSEGPVARITLKGRERESYLLAACRKPAEAEERKQLLASVAQRFRKAGVIDTRQARELLKTIASAPAALLVTALQVAGELAGGLARPGDKVEAPTFGAVGKDWADGKLHKLYPDHVRAKDSSVNKLRLEKINAIDVGGVRFGDIAVNEITLDHAQSVMGQLPEEAKRPATRRAYAQIVARVMALCVFPLRHVPASPLPRGFLPKIGKAPAYPYLYPNEEAALLTWTEERALAEQVSDVRPGVPLCRRVLYGFLSREGCRVSEAAGLTFSNVNLERGVVTLDANKTNDARAWAMDPAVARALKAYKELRRAGSADRVFVDEHGRLLADDSFAAALRADLAAAGVNRAELHVEGKNRRPIRAHDLRGTFATLYLANGKTETWICDRTGWRSSQMVAKYRRAARSAQELALGVPLPLDTTIPELSAIAQRLPRNSAPEGIRTPDQWIRNPPLFQLSYGRKCSKLRETWHISGWRTRSAGRRPRAARERGSQASLGSACAGRRGYVDASAWLGCAGAVAGGSASSSGSSAPRRVNKAASWRKRTRCLIATRAMRLHSRYQPHSVSSACARASSSSSGEPVSAGSATRSSWARSLFAWLTMSVVTPRSVKSSPAGEGRRRSSGQVSRATARSRPASSSRYCANSVGVSGFSISGNGSVGNSATSHARIAGSMPASLRKASSRSASGRNPARSRNRDVHEITRLPSRQETRELCRSEIRERFDGNALDRRGRRFEVRQRFVNGVDLELKVPDGEFAPNVAACVPDEDKSSSRVRRGRRQCAHQIAMCLVVVTEEVNVARLPVAQEDTRERGAAAQVKRYPAPAATQELEYGVGDDATIESFCHARLRGGHSADMSSSQPHIFRLRPR